MTGRVALAVLFWTSLAAAQLTERIEVEVTNLDLIVIDANGRPVRGLSKGDFEILENGRPREITNFSEVSVGTVAVGTIAQPPPRSILLLFDNSSLTLGARRMAAEAATEWVDQHVRPVDRVAVMTTIPTLQIKQPWTREKATISTAIETVAGESTSTSEQEWRDAERRIEEVINRARTASPQETVRFEEATEAARVYANSKLRDGRALLNAIAKALTSFSRPAEKRIVVIVGEGVAANPGAEVFARLNTWKMAIEAGGGPPRLLPGARTASPLTESMQFDLLREIDAVALMAIRSGAIMYALNPGHNERSGGGVQDSGPADLGSDFAKSTANMSGYDLLVRPTGGMAFYGAPPKLALERIGREIDSYYSVGYRPSPSPQRKPKITARTRQGHKVRVSRASGAFSADEMMKVAVLAHHVAPPETNDLRISVAVGQAAAEGNRRRVPLKILIPIALLRLEPEGNEVRGGFNVYLSTGNGEGSVSKVNRQSHEIRWPASMLDQARTKNMTFAVDVVLAPGANQISVGVLDQRSEQSGFELISVGL